MSRITFNFVEFKNFQSFGNNLTHVNLDQDQISLICGTNGAGKTCVIQTISYALFGKSLTGITKSELINNKNKNEDKKSAPKAKQERPIGQTGCQYYSNRTFSLTIIACKYFLRC